jgi:hypothetical protein
MRDYKIPFVAGTDDRGSENAGEFHQGRWFFRLFL